MENPRETSARLLREKEVGESKKTEATKHITVSDVLKLEEEEINFSNKPRNNSEPQHNKTNPSEFKSGTQSLSRATGRANFWGNKSTTQTYTVHKNYLEKHQDLIISDLIEKKHLTALNTLSPKNIGNSQIKELQLFVFMAKEFKNPFFLKNLQSCLELIPAKNTEGAGKLMDGIHEKEIKFGDKKEHLLDLPLIRQLTVSYDSVVPEGSNFKFIGAAQPRDSITAENIISNRLMEYSMDDDPATTITTLQILGEPFRRESRAHYLRFLVEEFSDRYAEQRKNRSLEYYKILDNILYISPELQKLFYQFAIDYSETVARHGHPGHRKKLTLSITSPCEAVYRGIMKKRVEEEIKLPKEEQEKIQDKVIKREFSIGKESFSVVYDCRDMGPFNKFLNNNNMGRIGLAHKQAYSKAIGDMQSFEEMNFTDEEIWESLIKLFHNSDFLAISGCDLSTVSEEFKAALGEILNKFSEKSSKTKSEKPFEIKEESSNKAELSVEELLIGQPDIVKKIAEYYKPYGQALQFMQLLEKYPSPEDTQQLMKKLPPNDILRKNPDFQNLLKEFEKFRKRPVLRDIIKNLLNHYSNLMLTKLPSPEFEVRCTEAIESYSAEFIGPQQKQNITSESFRAFVFHLVELMYSTSEKDKDLGKAIKSLLRKEKMGESPTTIIGKFKREHPKIMQFLLEMSNASLENVVKVFFAKYILFPGFLGSKVKDAVEEMPMFALATREEIPNFLDGYAMLPNVEFIHDLKSTFSLIDLPEFAKKQVDALLEDPVDELVTELKNLMSIGLLSLPSIKNSSNQQDFFEDFIDLAKNHKHDFRKAFTEKYKSVPGFAKKCDAIANLVHYKSIASRDYAFIAYVWHFLHYSELNSDQKAAIKTRDEHFRSLVFEKIQLTAAEFIESGFIKPNSKDTQVKRTPREQLIFDLENFGQEGKVRGFYDEEVLYVDMIAHFSSELAGLSKFPNPKDRPAVSDFLDKGVQSVPKKRFSNKKKETKYNKGIQKLKKEACKKFNELLLKGVKKKEREVKIASYTLALFTAIEADHYKLAQKTLKKLEASTDMLLPSVLRNTDASGRDLLEFAAQSALENKKSFILLLLRCYKSYQVIDTAANGLSKALFCAITLDDKAFIEELLSFPESTTQKRNFISGVLRSKNEKNQTALTFAQVSNKPNATQCLLDYCCKEGFTEIIRETISELNEKNKETFNIFVKESRLDNLGLAAERLKLAVDAQDAAVVETILKTDLNILKDKGKDLFAYALSENNRKVVETMLKVIVDKSKNDGTKDYWCAYISDNAVIMKLGSMSPSAGETIKGWIRPFLKELGVKVRKTSLQDFSAYKKPYKLPERVELFWFGKSSKASKGSSSQEHESSGNSPEIKSNSGNSGETKSTAESPESKPTESPETKPNSRSPEMKRISDSFITGMLANPDVEATPENIALLFFGPNWEKSVAAFQKLIRKLYELKNADPLIKVLKRIKEFNPDVFKTQFEKLLSEMLEKTPKKAKDKEKYEDLQLKVRDSLFKMYASPEVFIPRLFANPGTEGEGTQQNIEYYFTSPEHGVKKKSTKLVINAIQNLFEHENADAIVESLVKINSFQPEVFQKTFLIGLFDVYEKSAAKNPALREKIKTSLLQPCAEYIKTNYIENLIDKMVNQPGAVTDENINRIFNVQSWAGALVSSKHKGDYQEILEISMQVVKNNIKNLFLGGLRTNSLIMIFEKVSVLYKDIFLQNIFPEMSESYDKCLPENQKRLENAEAAVTALMNSGRITKKIEPQSTQSQLVPKENDTEAEQALSILKDLQNMKAALAKIDDILLVPFRDIREQSSFKMC